MSKLRKDSCPACNGRLVEIDASVNLRKCTTCTYKSNRYGVIDRGLSNIEIAEILSKGKTHGKKK